MSGDGGRTCKCSWRGGYRRRQGRLCSGSHNSDVWGGHRPRQRPRPRQGAHAPGWAQAAAAERAHPHQEARPVTDGLQDRRLLERRLLRRLQVVVPGGGTVRGVIGARAWALEDRRGRGRARVPLISHEAATFHLHAVEVYVGRRGWARVADVTRLRS